MTARYMSKLQTNGRIVIPVEICYREEFMLKKGALLRQSIEDKSIILYKTDNVIEAGAYTLDSKYIITLEQEYLDLISAKEGEALYFYVCGDLIIVEKACCEVCKAEERLVEYNDCHFRCISCIANTIHWEDQHRK